MKKLIMVFCLMMIGTTVVPKPCEEHHTLDYCWLEKMETKGFGNGDK